ncbi:redox-sensing transcriptional repressor Rex [Caloranaerobacter azorensis]|uniref:Redox-sensing transcriptional repressor Rex n=2 Tax=Caloranaerobacter azorensis TaxID=116090 RepID=A0A096BK52_9FIRM|nr:redox-sensing transcriptional repressor Rex [Caloranaerobacter azorensis]KGG81237.1 REX family transcriptional regulator [Caloranaerobacter azorensis H53214]QIB27460.1 redox-sensing transcriptional repressor Rex [Caloranaerobacter azorensis]
MRKSNKVSMAVIRRLPKYYRYLGELMENEVKRISSQQLSQLTGFTASQIRQDLNNFGGFGQQGYGYNVEDLHNQLGKILGLNRVYNTVIIGAGNLGHAIANYRSFEEEGFKVKAIFDVEPEVIGTEIRGIKVRDVKELEDFIKENQIDIGIICTPKDVSQEIADKLVNSGVKGIWNFAPKDLKVPDDVVVENVHLNESLFTLSYMLKERINR